MISSPYLVFLVLAAVVVLAIVLAERFRVSRALGSVLLALVLGGIMSNSGLLPLKSTAYDALAGPGASVAIVLILLGVDVRSVVQAGPRMGLAFVLGAVGSIAGAVLGALAYHRLIGPDAWKLAGQYTGTYIGGGVNMVAIGQALGTDPDVFSAAIAADNVTTAVWMVVCLALPVMLTRWWRKELTAAHRDGGTNGRGGATSGASGGVEPSPVPALSLTSTLGPVSIAEAALVLLVTGFVVWVSDLAAAAWPAIPRVLWLTTLALLLAQLGLVRALKCAPMLGYYALHLFLASLGAQSVVSEIVRVGPGVFYYSLTVVVVHGLLLFGIGRAVRLDLPTLAVASQANVGGPASALALATARDFTGGVLPGIAAGLLGYAVGNYAGFAVAHLVRGLLGT